MNTAFMILLGIAMIAVLVSLFVGLFAMGKESEKAKALSQKMMRARVYLQCAAIIFFILAMATSK